MQDGSFNDILSWDYSRLPEIFNRGKGFRVRTEGDLEDALGAARRFKEGFCILDVHLDPGDMSPALKRFTASMGKKVHAAKPSGKRAGS